MPYLVVQLDIDVKLIAFQGLNRNFLSRNGIRKDEKKHGEGIFTI